ncbi:MAG: ACT domain-containing protein [Cytophagales bacterium]|uniref:ACT domain-containing protein n=1 Tax=Cyclobacterium marinum TaxID=104 RepID=UPI0011F01014|nr:ACT domain-containing protein [Cyclobacterium marinum]MBI0401559.1 ACT domain-containing protein [Cyclobacterium marinum]MBR9775608.1 ACT domain-containing protein [Cytophagales bacterium]|tara:strand:- start:71553 stop:71951 length:399 start_codon:yes stop_codon:yes gene_type:complete
MAEVKNLKILLKTMNPRLNEGEYVYCTVQKIPQVDMDQILFVFKEQEGFTLVLNKKVADELYLNYSFVASWITLTVHSSLKAIGLTAAFSKALTANNISCNVVAGYYHDHLFVEIKDAQKAMVTLKKFSEEQ